MAIDLLDAVLALVDRFVSLLSVRVERHRELFDDYLDPLFRDLRLVADHYATIFNNTLIRLLEPTLPIDEAVRYLRSQREQNRRLRRELIQLLRELRKARKTPQEVKDFCAVCAWVLFNTEIIDYDICIQDNELQADPGGTSRSGSLLEVLENGLSNGSSRYELAERVAQETADLERIWTETVGSYYRLRLKYLA